MALRNVIPKHRILWYLPAPSGGATVFATSSSDEKLLVAKKSRAAHVINYNYKKTPDWVKEVLKITGGRGKGDCTDSKPMVGELSRLISVVKLNPVVGKVFFDFEQAKEVYAYLSSQKHVGRIVINIFKNQSVRPEPLGTTSVERIGEEWKVAPRSIDERDLYRAFGKQLFSVAGLTSSCGLTVGVGAECTRC
ncbi:hypothetical protein C8Q74DRAFT_1221566 [Fomes fomentarius]|nr:hypothetical protein C8Q74DRAFT_1221566 [Fomes fomentarius]